MFMFPEQDQIPVVSMAGPLHKMNVRSNALGKSPFLTSDFPWGLIDDVASLRIMPGMFFSDVSTQIVKKLPADAEPGTYVVFLKFNRYFMGERTAKMTPYFIQVGQEEETSYPGKVGNCQICHRGVLSMDNLRHGLSVDHVEGCKACHNLDNDLFGRVQETIHRLHMRSPKYRSAKNDCTVCHMTRDSTVRPSITTCMSCHPSVHGDRYFQARFSPSGEINRFSNCAETCHGGAQAPKNHIIPAN
jgi:hypothetical protein